MKHGGSPVFRRGRRGVLKNNIYEELPKKGGLDTLQGDWQKIGRRVFLWGVDTSMHIMI